MLNKRSRNKHEIKREKGKRNLVIDCLNELEINKLESQMHQNNHNLPTLFLPDGVSEAKTKLRTTLK